MGKGGGGGTSHSTQNTTVNVQNDITAPPINIAIGSDVLQPVADAFLPVTQGVSQANLNQAQAINAFLTTSSQQLASYLEADQEADAKLVKGITDFIEGRTQEQTTIAGEQPSFKADTANLVKVGLGLLGLGAVILYARR